MRALALFFLLYSTGVAATTPEKTQAAQNSTAITHESYTDFLKTVAAVDACHFFEEKGGQIIRFGKVGSYDYLATTEERGATPGYFINAPFMNAFEAECYCAWKNRVPQGAKEYAHDQISWLDSYHGHQNDLKDLNSYPPKNDAAASPCAHPLYTIEIQGRSMTEVDPLLKSNLLTYQLKTDQDQLLKPTAGEEEVVSEVVNSLLEKIEASVLLLAPGLAGISTSALHSSSRHERRHGTHVSGLARGTERGSNPLSARTRDFFSSASTESNSSQTSHESVGSVNSSSPNSSSSNSSSSHSSSPNSSSPHSNATLQPEQNFVLPEVVSEAVGSGDEENSSGDEGGYGIRLCALARGTERGSHFLSARTRDFFSSASTESNSSQTSHESDGSVNSSSPNSSSPNSSSSHSSSPHSSSPHSNATPQSKKNFDSPQFNMAAIYSPGEIVTPNDNALHPLNRNADVTPQRTPSQQSLHSSAFQIGDIYSSGSPIEREMVHNTLREKFLETQACASFVKDVLQNAANNVARKQECNSFVEKLLQNVEKTIDAKQACTSVLDDVLQSVEKTIDAKQACTSVLDDVLQSVEKTIDAKQAYTSVLEELLQNAVSNLARKQAFTSVMQEILKKVQKQHAWTRVEGPTEAVSSTPHTVEYNSTLEVLKTGVLVDSPQEYPAESTTNPLKEGAHHEPSAPGTQTRPPYFNYPGFGVIGGIGMGVGALGLSGIPWIATYAEDQISYVTIGDAGNLPDPFAYPESWGSVDYEFEMSTTPVTQGQWLAYLNTVARKEDPNHLWNDAMPIIRNGTQGRYSYSLKDPDKKNQPITHVSYTNAKSYCQWQSDTSGNSENTNSAITYDIPTPDEYLKAHFYNPQALQEIGGYEDAPCDVYGTEPPQENFYEWTRGADTEKKLFILSTSTTSPFNIEQIEPKIEREDLGFSVVKRTSLSFEQKNKKEKECLKKTQSYCEKKSQDITLLEDKNQLWSNAAVSLSNSIICLENSQQELLVSCKTAAAFYLASIQASLSSREFHKRETECWNNAGDYFVNYLTNEYPDHQQNYKEAIAYSTKSAIEYTFLNKYLAYNYAIAAYDAVKNFDSQTSIPTINKLTPFIKNKISIEK